MEESKPQDSSEVGTINISEKHKKVETSTTCTDGDSQDKPVVPMQSSSKINQDNTLSGASEVTVNDGKVQHPSSTSSTASSLNRKTWSVRLRDKLEKREKNAVMAAAQEYNEKLQRKEGKGEDPFNTALHRVSTKKTGQKKQRHKSHPASLSSGGGKVGIASVCLTAGGKPALSHKTASYHLTPSLLEDVLNEKKMSLMRSPDVISELQKLQQNVNINKLLATAPVVKTEDTTRRSHVKTERDAPNAVDKAITIGHVIMVNIKKEEEEDIEGTESYKPQQDHAVQNLDNTTQNENNEKESRGECGKRQNDSERESPEENAKDVVMDSSTD